MIKNQRCWAYISSPKSKCAVYSTLQANTILALDSHGDCWKTERKRETLYPSQGPLALSDMCHTSWILSPAKEWVGAHLASVHHPTGPPPHSPLHQVGPTLCPVLLGAQDGGPAAHGALCLEGLSCVAIPGMTLPFLLGMMGGSPGPQDPSCHFLPVPHPSLGQGWRGWRG